MQNARTNVIDEQRPDRTRPLLVEKGVFTRRDLAPAGYSVRKHFDQDDVAFICAAETGFEEMNERHADVPQNDAVYCEAHLPNKYVPAAAVFSNPITARPALK